MNKSYMKAIWNSNYVIHVGKTSKYVCLCMQPSHFNLVTSMATLLHVNIIRTWCLFWLCQKMLISWGFQVQPSPGFTKDCLKNKKKRNYAVSSSSLNCWCQRRKVRLGWADRKAKTPQTSRRQQTTPAATPVSAQQEETERTICTSSPKVDDRRLEKCSLVWIAISAVTFGW